MVNTVDKETKYRELIENVRQSYLSHSNIEKQVPQRMEWCEDCKEINLWTYWQGQSHLNARLMLVGQDWGSPWDDASAAVMNNIRKKNSGIKVGYMDGNSSITDKNLIQLFDSIGYKICEERKDNEDLLFTNLVLGYRSSGTSGGFKSSWITHDAGFFRELTNIIEPEVMLCLGRTTFEGVLHALQYHLPTYVGSYNQIITSDQNPIEVKLENNKKVRIFALAHCGVLGTMNRNRGSDPHQKLDLQIKDWERIKKYI